MVFKNFDVLVVLKLRGQHVDRGGQIGEMFAFYIRTNKDTVIQFLKRLKKDLKRLALGWPRQEDLSELENSLIYKC